MAITSYWYGNGALNICKGQVNWPADTIKVMLCTDGYVPDQDNQDYKNDVANEISGAGYTAGGEALQSKTVAYDGTSNTVKLDADDVSWTSSSITARYAVIYKDTGDPATSPLLGYVNFGSDASSADGTFSIIWDANGIFKITVA